MTFFQRCTPGALQVVVRAGEEARASGSAEIDTDHVLLALLRGDDDATGRAVRAAGVDASAVQARVAERPTREPPAGTAQPPFSPATKKLFEQALRAGLRLRVETRPITRALLLRGLLEVQDSAGARLLQDLGVDLTAFARICDDLVLAAASGDG
jgi:ATP-dependent Clp protease ATP-binding subunit ClpC